MACASNSKVNTIKVKLVDDEDFHDLVIDWSLTEYAERQVFRQLAQITGIPVENTSGFFILKHENAMTLTVSALNNVQRQHNFTRDRVMNVVEEGDKFYISTTFHCRMDRRLWIGYRLVDENLTEQFNCTPDFCRHSNTRAIIDRQRQLVTNEMLRVILSQQLAIGNINQWNQVFKELNIAQHFNLPCSLSD